MTPPGKPKKRSPRNPPPTHGGARPGSGRNKRDTHPITVRLHTATLNYLGDPKGRSERIERLILRVVRWGLQSSTDKDPEQEAALKQLIKSYTANGELL